MSVAQKQYLLAYCVLILCLLICVFILQNNRIPNILEQSTIPTGWYEYTLGTTNGILTRTKSLPKIKNTEGYAYGEQITFGIVPFTGNQYDPEHWEPLAWTNDTATVHHKEWLVLDGHRTLKIDAEAGGASGMERTYFIFASSSVHILSLYPLSLPQNIPIFETFVRAYIQDEI